MNEDAGTTRGPGIGQVRSGSDSVLLVDDEPSILRLFRVMLRSGIPQARIECAENGSEAIRKFEKERADVLVLDLCMPVMDGQRAFLEIEKLCEVREWAMPAVVFCSAFAPPGAVRERIAADPRHCLLHKPIFNSELVDAVKARLSE